MKKLFSREFIAYGVFGLLTTLANILTFQLLFEHAGIAYGVANVVAVLAAKVFAYITNKLFVFRSRCENTGELVLEIVKYVFARGFTGLVDIFGMFLAVEMMGVDVMLAKYAIQVIVIVLNYVLGKSVVFRKYERRKTAKAYA